MSHREFFDRWFLELWTRRNPGIIDECVSEECIIHGLPETQYGRTAFHEFFRLFGGAFPVIEIVVEDCVSEGEKFGIRCRGHVVDQDGRRHEFTGGGMGKVSNGQIVEAWNQWDFHSIIESMGMIEPGIVGKSLQRERTRLRPPA